MFEATLLSSSIQNTTRTRWIVATSLLSQGAAVTALILVPLLYPATLPVMAGAPRVVPIAVFRRPEPRREIARPVPVSTPQTNAPHAPAQQATQVATAVRGGSIAHAPGGSFSNEDPLCRSATSA